MKPPAETVRITSQGRDQLIKIRRQTGLENWNIICRWALCVSMREPTSPADPKEKLDGGVEMTWRVFAGEEAEVFAALVALRARRDGFAENAEGTAKCLRAHINRGLSYLSSGKETKSMSDFIGRWSS